MRKLIGFSLGLSLLFCFASAYSAFLSQKGPYFIDTERCLQSYQPLLDANKMVEMRDQAIKVKMKTFDDSLAHLMDTVSEHRAKGEELLSLLNLESNVYRHQLLDSTSHFAQASMAEALDSFNSTAGLFSKKDGIPVLFGSSNNTVVFGSGKKADKTEAFLQYMEHLNE